MCKISDAQQQARAIDALTNATNGRHTVTHDLGEFTITADHHVDPDTRTARYWAHDDTGILAAAEARTRGPHGVLINTRVTAFRSRHLFWTSVTAPGERATRYLATGRGTYELSDTGRPGQPQWTIVTAAFRDLPRFVTLPDALAYIDDLDTR